MNEDKLRNYTNTQYDSIITIYSHDIKPNWLRFDTQSLRDHPTSAKLQVAKTRVGVTGVGPVSTRAPTGRGQIWTRARICPPALEVETYVPGAEVILSQNNSGHELLPSNNIGRTLIAYFFFFWPFYQKTHSLNGRNALLFCLIVSCLSLTSDLHLLLRPGRGLWWQLFLIYYQWLSILFVFLT